MDLGQAINKRAWGNRGSDRAKVVGVAGRGYDIDFGEGDISRACLSLVPDLAVDQWVTAQQNPDGSWTIIGQAGNAPAGNFAPEPPEEP